MNGCIASQQRTHLSSSALIACPMTHSRGQVYNRIKRMRLSVYSCSRFRLRCSIACTRRDGVGHVVDRGKGGGGPGGGKTSILQYLKV
jgi:hypothetical protein